MALRLWSKLDSAEDVTSPTIGVGGTVTGTPTFEPAKYDNGIYTTHGNFAEFPTVANSINANKGTIEFWAKLKFPYPTPGTDVGFFFAFRSSAAGGGVSFHYARNTDRWYVQALYEAYKFVLLGPVLLTWDENDLLHFKIIWDRQGAAIGDGKTLVLIVDDEEKASATQKWDAALCSSSLFVGCSAGVNPPWSVIDDLRTYDECVINGPPSVPGVPDGLLCEQQTNPTNVTDPNPEFSAIYHAY